MKRICLCSSLLPREAIRRLETVFRVIPLPPDMTVDEPVRCHPDMICAVMDGTLFFHESYASAYPDVIGLICSESGFRTVLTAKERSPVYPRDIALNAAVLPGALLCKASHTAAELLRAAEESGRRVISVKQGYAACSSLVCGESVLTSDRGIYSSLAAHGIDCDYISPNGIILPGYGGGFIGGCGGFAGALPDGKIYLTGRPDALPDRAALYSFAEKHGFTIECLTDAPLTDFGGLKFL